MDESIFGKRVEFYADKCLREGVVKGLWGEPLKDHYLVVQKMDGWRCGFALTRDQFTIIE